LLFPGQQKLRQPLVLDVLLRQFIERFLLLGRVGFLLSLLQNRIDTLAANFIAQIFGARARLCQGLRL
jgi:hypothetical protein